MSQSLKNPCREAVAEQPGNISQLFPLRFSPFEAYLLADDRPDYPMQFFFRLVFHGRLDRAALLESLNWSVARHPLLRSTVRQRFGQSPVWHEGFCVDLRDCQQGFEQLAEVYEAPNIDLSSEPGLRTWLFQETGKAEVLFQFHHSCCDGIGARQLIEELFLRYHSITNGHKNDEPVALHAGLNSRAKLRITVWEALRKIPIDIKDLFRISFRRPATISTSSNDEITIDANESRSGFFYHEFSADELDGLLCVSREQGTTLTNVVMRDLYCSIDHLLSRHVDERRRWIRIAVPTDLRVKDETARPCCNQVSIMFIDQNSRHIRDAPQRLLERIARQTAFRRRFGQKYSMLQTLRFLAVMPPLLRFFIRTKRHMCTSILSNLGRVFESCSLPRVDGKLRTGDLVLESIDFLVPLRRDTEVTFGMLTYAGKLKLCMHYQPQRVCRTHAKELFERLVESVRESSAGRQP